MHILDYNGLENNIENMSVSYTFSVSKQALNLRRNAIIQSCFISFVFSYVSPKFAD